MEYKTHPVTVDASQRLTRLIETSGEKLQGFTEMAAAQPLGEGRWSRKQILGHLIDSASNNHQRFVRAQFEDPHVSPGYSQDEWVNSQRYQQAPWRQLVDLWVAYNRHLVHIASCIPEGKLKHLVKIADHEPVTLEFVVTDYVAHLEHHLKQMGI